MLQSHCQSAVHITKQTHDDFINNNKYMFTLEGNYYFSNTFYDKEDAMLVRLIKDLEESKILFTKKMRPTGGITIRIAVAEEDLKDFKKN